MRILSLWTMLLLAAVSAANLACSASPTEPTPIATVPPAPVVEAVGFETAPVPAWRAATGGPINAAPLPVGDAVAVAPVGGPLLMLEAATGDVRWQYQPEGRLWERALATDGERVFVGEEGAKLTALDAASGEVLWQRELGINAQMAPQVADGVLYVPTTFVGPGLTADPQGRAKLLALNPADGSERWSFETGNYILQTPYVHGDTVYVGGSYDDPTFTEEEGGPMRVYAISTADGQQRWVYEGEDGFVKALFANQDTLAYIAYQDFANGLDAVSGEPRWRRDTGNWVPSLSGAGETVYFSSANTVVHALDTASGEARWTYNIGGDSFNYGLGAPVWRGDSLFVLSQKGDIIRLNAADGAEQWRLETGIVGSRDGLSVGPRHIFVGDAEGNVHAFAVE